MLIEWYQYPVSTRYGGMRDSRIHGRIPIQRTGLCNGSGGERFFERVITITDGAPLQFPVGANITGVIMKFKEYEFCAHCLRIAKKQSR